MRLAAEQWAARIARESPVDWSQPVLDHARPGMRTLEIGAGSATAKRLLALGVDARVADFGPSGGERFPGRSYCFDVLDTWPEEEFDIIHSVGLFEHFSDDQIIHVLQECRKRATWIIHLVPNARCAAYCAWKREWETSGKWKWGDEFPRETLQPQYAAAGIPVCREYSIGADFPAPDGERYLLATVGKVNHWRLSLVQVFHNNAADVPITAAATLREADRLTRLGHTAQVIFVDDGSIDGTGTLLRQMLRGRRGVAFIQNRERRGRSATYNQGIGVSTGDYLLLLSGATAPLPLSERLAEHLSDHPECLGVGPDPRAATASHGVEFPVPPSTLTFEPARDCTGRSAGWWRHTALGHYLLLPSWPFRPAGIRFDSSASFVAVGGGWQDVDLLWQLQKLGRREIHHLLGIPHYYAANANADATPEELQRDQALYVALKQFGVAQF